MGYEPEGQRESGFPTAAGRNPKRQPHQGDGSEGLPDGATSTHFVGETVHVSKPGGSDQSSAVINDTFSTKTSDVPNTRNVSTNRVKRISPESGS